MCNRLAEVTTGVDDEKQEFFELENCNVIRFMADGGIGFGNGHDEYYLFLNAAITQGLIDWLNNNVHVEERKTLAELHP